MKRHLLTVSTAALSLLAGAANAADKAQIYSASFDAPAYIAGVLPGQDKWSVTPAETSKAAAVILDRHSSDGSSAVHIDASVLGGGDTEWLRPIGHTGSMEHAVIDVSFDMLLEADKPRSMAWQFTVYSSPSHAIASLFVTPIAADKNDVLGFRTGDADPVLTETAIRRNAWNHFRIRIDLAHRTAEYFVNEVAVTTPGARSVPVLPPDAVIGEIGIRVMGPAADAASIDSIAIGYPAAKECVANCDASDVAPILNINDFLCFVNEFSKASGEAPEKQVELYANYDHSATGPILNVNDFVAFMNAYAAGCP